jgi:hypothetical protein
LATLEQKEIEKKKIYKLYNEKYRNCSNIAEKVKKNKEKLDIIKRKNQNLKILICKLMKENNNIK